MTSLLDFALAGKTPRDFPPLLIRENELADFRDRLGPALLEQIHKAGLDEAVLFVIYRLHRERKPPRPTESAAVRGMIRRRLLRDGETLKKAAEALESLLLVELPYNPEALGGRQLLGNEIDVQNGFRLPAPDEAAASLRSLKIAAATFSEADLNEIAPEYATAWKRVSAMNDTEYYPHFVNERAAAACGLWLLPFWVSDNLFEVFRGKRIGCDAVLRALSGELLNLAGQAFFAAQRVTALGSPTGKGRKRSTAQESFQAMFSEYATRMSGRKHDAIGAKLFSLTFGSKTKEVYARQRRGVGARRRTKST